MATKNIVPNANGEGSIGTATKGWGAAFVTNASAPSNTAGGKLTLISNDGTNALDDNDQLGIIEFKGAESSSAVTIGASIEAICDADWSASENGASLVFKTTDGDNTQSTVLTLDSNKNVTIADGDLIIGTSDHGISFAATADGSGSMSGEVLDDYEEGTWTPTYVTSSASSSVTYNTQTGYYTKIGNQVTCWGFLSTNTSTWNGVYVQLDGQPYASANGNMTMGIVSYAHSFGGDHPRAIYYGTSTRNYLTYRDAVDGNDIELQASDMDAGNGGKNIIIFTFSFQAS